MGENCCPSLPYICIYPNPYSLFHFNKANILCAHYSGLVRGADLAPGVRPLPAHLEVQLLHRQHVPPEEVRRDGRDPARGYGGRKGVPGEQRWRRS